MNLSTETTQGRTIIARFKPNQDLITAINNLLIEKNIKAGYIPTLIGGLKSLRLATRQAGEDENHPAIVQSEFKEAFEYFGMGTIATVDDKPSIHIHLSGGKTGGESVAGHLLSAEIVLLTEVVIVECVDIRMTRVQDPTVYNYPLLSFE